MSTDCALLLISDRVDGGRELAGRINSLHRCWAIGLYNDAKSAVPSASAIVIDVALMDGLAIGRLQYLLSLYRRPTAEAVAILRTGTRRERVQAAALGATIIFAADVSVPELVASLVPTIRPAAATAVSARRLNGTPSIAKTRLQFEALFVGAAQGEPVIKSLVEEATETVLAALAESSIRQWLEVVWTYDDATYQHCLLVTGVAAAFAIDLKFSESDQRQLTQGALLHDVGKAKIPLAILNKPGALSSEEMEVIKTHPKVGYELLVEQQDYSSDILEVVLWHHELLDGSGYPHGLVGAKIPDLVRLATICDIYSALIERRSYRPPLAPAEAFKILHGMDGKVEGALVRSFAKIAEQCATAHAPQRPDTQVSSQRSSSNRGQRLHVR